MFCGPEAVTYLSLPIYLSTNLLNSALVHTTAWLLSLHHGSDRQQRSQETKKELAGSLTTQDIGLRETDYGHAPEIFVDHKG